MAVAEELRDWDGGYAALITSKQAHSAYMKLRDQLLRLGTGKASMDNHDERKKLFDRRNDLKVALRRDLRPLFDDLEPDRFEDS